MFVDDLEHLHLADDDRNHLARALRVRDGDALTVSDGAGHWRRAVFGDQLSAGGPVHSVAAPRYEVGLAVALTKSGKPELVVQKATEIGIDRIVLFQADHSVARWDSTKRAKGLDRLAKVAREAAMQSRRVRLPAIEFGDNLAAVAARLPVVRADFDGAPLTAEHAMIAIGPEGGWSSAEVGTIPATIDLGPTVLRAETAALVAATHMVSCRLRSRD